MTVRKIVISFCKNIESSVRLWKVCNEINKRTGRIFVLCRVEFSEIGKRDVTFIREMRVEKIRVFPRYFMMNIST